MHFTWIEVIILWGKIKFYMKSGKIHLFKLENSSQQKYQKCSQMYKQLHKFVGEVV